MKQRHPARADGSHFQSAADREHQNSSFDKLVGNQDHSLPPALNDTAHILPELSHFSFTDRGHMRFVSRKISALRLPNGSVPDHIRMNDNIPSSFLKSILHKFE
jgi:hypothetical protein